MDVLIEVLRGDFCVGFSYSREVTSVVVHLGYIPGWAVMGTSDIARLDPDFR